MKYTPEFRRRVLDLVKAGKSVAQVAFELGVIDQTVDNWREQDLIDSGLKPGTTSTDNTELTDAKRRIDELESEGAIHQRAAELLKSAVAPKGATKVSP